MSFHIKLYRYDGEPNRLDKKLSNELDLVGFARESIDKMNSIIKIELTNSIQYNYAYISEFNRYYFITNDTIDRNNIHTLTLKTDVLMSHRNSILSCSGIVGRNENVFNSRLIDDKLRFLGYKEVNTIAFPNSVSNAESFILAVNGG